MQKEIKIQENVFREAIQADLALVKALSEDERPKEDNSALLQRISKQMKDIEDWQRLKTVNLSIAQNGSQPLLFFERYYFTSLRCIGWRYFIFI